jgi:L-lactate dehydrogenase complex protein LldF
MLEHARKAGEFLKDRERADWQDKALWVVRENRDKAAGSVPDWENLREQASVIKSDVLSHLDEYFSGFEAAAVRNGVKVHWAYDAKDLREIVLGIIRSKNAIKIVKSKSMLTEECGLNPFLESNGIGITDTDLGERIIQLRNEPPSHIVLPAIHLRKEEIGELFHEKLNTEKGASDPTYLTGAARIHLRKKFLESQVAITGVNFAVAETGAVIVCTNEGNADMGIHSAPVQIHCMGIEKIIPKTSDLGVFTRLLARNATGQPVTTYTSHCLKPKPGGEMHVVIVDNGRSDLLGDNSHRNSLKCIRCGACLNTCPVYRRSGGYSYRYLIPGPIGSLLALQSDTAGFKDLAFACSLCGSCTDVCPVKIDIHHQLYRWRQEITDRKLDSFPKRMILGMVSKILANNRLYNYSGEMARWALRILPRKMVYMKLNTWGWGRELPVPPRESFKEWYSKNQIH